MKISQFMIKKFLNFLLGIAILIVILATLMIYCLNLINGNPIRMAKIQIAEISGALTLYKMEYGCYPLTNPGLQLLLLKNKEDEKPFMRSIPLDPWKVPYYYFSDGHTYKLGSYKLDKIKEE